MSGKVIKGGTDFFAGVLARSISEGTFFTFAGLGMSSRDGIALLGGMTSIQDATGLGRSKDGTELSSSLFMPNFSFLCGWEL